MRDQPEALRRRRWLQYRFSPDRQLRRLQHLVRIGAFCKRRRLVALQATIAALGLVGCISKPQIDVPQCPSPAPLEGTWDSRAPRYIVYVHPGRDKNVLMSKYAERFRANPRSISSDAFAIGAIPPEAVAELRCEAGVARVVHDEYLEKVVERVRQ